MSGDSADRRGPARFEGRVACVVGAASGIGLACAERLVSENARVAMCDRSDDALRMRSAALAGTRPYPLDVRDSAAVDATIARIEDDLGPLDLLVVTSGVFRAQSMLETSDADWQEIFGVNVFGAAAVLRAAGRRMRDRRRGAIVVVASQSAVVVRARQAAYGSSKAALTYLAKAFGLELAPFGIRVNVVQPGVTDTPLARTLWDAGRGSEEDHIQGSLAAFRVPIPLGRVGQAHDVAAAVTYLLSDDAAHVTMSEVIVDGGAAMKP